MTWDVYKDPSKAKEESSLNTFNVPAEKRHRTNGKFLVIFAIFISIWFALSFYCILNGNGNLSHYIEIPKNSSKDALKDLEYWSATANHLWRYNTRELRLSCAIAIGFSILLVALLRYHAETVTWLLFGLIVVGLIISTVMCWYYWIKEHNTNSEKKSSKTKDESSIAYPIVLTIITIVVSVIIFTFRKHIKLTIVLFTESGKVIQAIPLVMLQPLVTLAATIVSFGIAVYFFLMIETSSHPEKDHTTGNITYKENTIMQVARIYNVLAISWILLILNGCQHMVIAGAVVRWFFTRDKSQINGALSKSYACLFKFHLGSVILGSLIILIVKILRAIYKALSKKDGSRSLLCLCVFGTICKLLEKFIVFLTENAYIEMAIYGENFWKSGKRAFHVVTSSVVKLTTINTIGSWVMSFGILVVTVCSVLMGYLLTQHKIEEGDMIVYLIIIGIFAFIVSKAFMNVFETIVDSVFICFCEDCNMNDGVKRPYFMSKRLKVFINTQ